MGFLAPSTNSIEYKDEDKVVLEDMLVYPAQTPRYDSDDYSDYGFDFDKEFYSQDTWYPEERANVSETSIMREVCVAHTGIVPFEYNPAKRELIVHPQMLVTVYHKPGAEGYEDWSMPIGADPDFVEMYRSVVVNYDNLGMAEVDTTTIYDYLIITNSEFAYSANQLHDFLELRDHSVMVHQINTVNWQMIYNDIYAFYVLYDNDYVLLIGDDQHIPVPLKYLNGSYIPSDQVYADLWTPSMHCPGPTVAVGRLSVSSFGYAQLQVNKIEDHYNHPNPQAELKCLLVAHGYLEVHFPPYGYIFVNCKEDVRNYQYYITQPQFRCIYGNDPQFDNQDIIDAINSGQRVVNYTGHGDETTWSYWDYYNDYFTFSDIDQINPGYFRPAVFSICCLTGDITYEGGECFCERWMNDIGGAVAIVGATIETPIDTNSPFDKWIFKVLYGRYDQPANAIYEPEGHLGIMHNWAKMKMLAEFYGGEDWDSALKTYYAFLLLGDPSLWILPSDQEPQGISGMTGVDKDNQIAVTAIKQPSLTIYPNPVCEVMSLNVESLESGPAEIRIYDLSGRVVFDKELSVNCGNNLFAIDLADIGMKSGVYVVQFSSPGISEKNTIVFTH